MEQAWNLAVWRTTVGPCTSTWHYETGFPKQRSQNWMWPQNPTSTASCIEYLCSPYRKDQVYQIYILKYQLPQKVQDKWARIVIWQTVSFAVEKPEECRQPYLLLTGWLFVPETVEHVWGSMKRSTVACSVMLVLNGLVYSARPAGALAHWPFPTNQEHGLLTFMTSLNAIHRSGVKPSYLR